jgi:hypothetical protein
MARDFYTNTHMTVPECIAGIVSLEIELPTFDQKITEAQATGVPAAVVKHLKRQRAAKKRWLTMKTTWLEMQTQP